MDTLATASNVLQSGNEVPASTGLLLSLQDLKGGLLNTPKKWKRKLCCLNACRKVTVPANRRVSYFKVRSEWYKIIREARKEPRWIPQTADVRLCSLHFTDDQFKILDKIYVKEKALPTEYLICDDDDESPSTSSSSTTQSNQVLVASVGANQKPINPKYIDMSFIHSRNNYNNNKTNFVGIKSRIKSTPQQKRISLIKTEMMKSAVKTITNKNITPTTTSTPTNTVVINNNNNNLNLTEAFILPDQEHLLDQNQHQFIIQQQQQPHQVFIINNNNIQNNNGQEILQQQQEQEEDEQQQQQQSFNVLIQDSTNNTINSTNIPETTTISNVDSSGTIINNFTISTPATMVNNNDNNNLTTTTTSTTTTNTNTFNNKTTTLESGECREISSNSIVLVNLKRPGIASKFYNSSKRNKNNPSSSSTLRRITNATNCTQSFSKIAASFRANKMMMNNNDSTTTTMNNDNMNNNNNIIVNSSQDPLALASQSGTSSNNNIVNNTYHHIAHMRKSRAASPTRKIEKLKQVNATLRTKVYQKTRQITRLDKRITNLKKQNKELEDQLSLDEIEIAAVNALKENPIMKTIIETEIQRQKLKKACTKGMRYTDEMKRLAVTIFKLSLPTYKFLRKGFAMPEESSIREWISGQDVSGTNVQNIIQDISLTRKPRQVMDIHQDPSSSSSSHNMLAPSTVTTLIPETVITTTTTIDSSNTIMSNFTMPSTTTTTNNDVLDVEGIVVHEFEIQHDETVHDDDDVGNNVSVVVMQDPHNIVHDYEQNLDLQQVEMEVDGNTVTEVSVTDMSELLLLSQ